MTVSLRCVKARVVAGDFHEVSAALDGWCEVIGWTIAVEQILLFLQEITLVFDSFDSFRKLCFQLIVENLFEVVLKILFLLLELLQLVWRKIGLEIVTWRYVNQVLCWTLFVIYAHQIFIWSWGLISVILILAWLLYLFLIFLRLIHIDQCIPTALKQWVGLLANIFYPSLVHSSFWCQLLVRS